MYKTTVAHILSACLFLSAIPLPSLVSLTHALAKRADDLLFGKAFFGLVDGVCGLCIVRFDIKRENG